MIAPGRRVGRWEDQDEDGNGGRWNGKWYNAAREATSHEPRNFSPRLSHDPRMGSLIMEDPVSLDQGRNWPFR